MVTEQSNPANGRMHAQLCSCYYSHSYIPLNISLKCKAGHVEIAVVSEQGARLQ